MTQVRKKHTAEFKAKVALAAQVRRLLDAPDLGTEKGRRDSAFLHILFFTGCRIAESCRLRVGDLFEDCGYFVLEFTVKGGKTNRLAIHQELQIALRRYLAAEGHSGDPAAALLQRTDGRAGDGITPRQALNLFRAYARRVGIPPAATPHSARVTFITQALEHGCRLEAVQQSVAHANIQTTRMYDKRTLLHRESASFAMPY